MTAPAQITDTDAVVIGAGPVGLFQVFQLGLQEIRAVLVDALPHPGGQCAELYASKPIYDIPAVPLCTGQELTDRLLQQIAPFPTPMHLNQQIESLQREPDGRWRLTSSAGMTWRAPVVIVAAGVGAFVPRKVALPELAVFESGDAPQVRYHRVDASELAHRQVVVMGGEDAALDTALSLARDGRCSRVTLLHRVDRFKADAPLLAALEQAVEAGQIHLMVGQPVGLQTDGTRLTALRLATPDTPDGETVACPVDVLLPRLGLSPKLGPVAEWGLAMERKQIVVDTERFATSEPGIFAVGDVNTYPGKRKLILCGFHEATLAAFAAAALVHPQRRQLLQYTTTSPRLHELLGVSPGV